MSDNQEASSNLHTSTPTPPNGDGDVHCLVSKFERLELDRFIPNRSTTNWDYGRAVLTERLPWERSFGDVEPGMTEYHVLYTLKLKRELGVDTSRIFYYRTTERRGKRWSIHQKSVYQDWLKWLAPGLVADQINLNLLDWGTNNVVAIGLKEQLFYHDLNADEWVLGFNYGDGLISSVGWCPEGLDTLAVGLGNSVVHVRDPYAQQTITALDSRGTGSLAWNGRILTTGNLDGHIVNYDLRVGSLVSQLPESHKGAICGLEWSASGQLLASGGSDNVVHVWDARSMQTRWLHKLEDHDAAVRAMAWNPLKRHLLASGGGQGDHYIRLWDASSGTPHENAVDTGSEVCGLFWSQQYRDMLCSAHGNRLVLWRSPVLFRIDETELTIDYDLPEDRPRPFFFYSTQSPDGYKVAMAGSDERLRYYEVFTDPPPPQPVPKPPFSTYNNRPNRYTLR